MKLVIKSLLAMSLFTMAVITQAAPINPTLSPRVSMETNKGTIVIELNAVNAPLTTENFIEYVKSGYFDGLVFHRVIENFMIQGGGFDKKMVKKATRGPVKNESMNGLSNRRGTIAMARTKMPDSATAQFFINLKDNNFLNGQMNKPGYTVFGKVIDGMKVVDTIAGVKTERFGPHGDVPSEPVIINKAVLKASPVKTKKKAVPVKEENK